MPVGTLRGLRATTGRDGRAFFDRKIAEGNPDEVRNNAAVVEAYLGTASAAA